MRAFGRAIAAGCIAMLAVGGGAGASAETLTDAIALAYETNPTLQAQRAQLRATDEEWVQAEASLRPTVTATGSYQYQHEQISVPGFAGSATIAGPSGTAVVTVNQPIYTGGLATSKLNAAQADILAGREGLRRTEITVIQSVVGAYLDVRRDQEQLAISQDNVNVLARQLDETTAKFDAGVLTRTDVAQSQARLALARSQLATAQSTLAQARAGYAAVVGQNPGDLAPEPPIATLLPPSVDAAFDAAERDNPQLRQAAYRGGRERGAPRPGEGPGAPHRLGAGPVRLRRRALEHRLRRRRHPPGKRSRRRRQRQRQRAGVRRRTSTPPRSARRPSRTTSAASASRAPAATCCRRSRRPGTSSWARGPASPPTRSR